jgi:hypothetical protein
MNHNPEENKRNRKRSKTTLGYEGREWHVLGKEEEKDMVSFFSEVILDGEASKH